MLFRSSPITPTAAFNVSSITRNGTGDFTVNFTNTLASANYAIATSGLVTSGDNRGGFFIGVKSPSNTSRGTSSVRLFSNQGSTTASNAIAANSTDTSVIVFL